MRINGEWHIGDDGIVRPILRGEIAAADGSWVQVLFLVDTGADCTALSADTLAVLGFSPGAPSGRLGGVGGLVENVAVETRIHVMSEDGGMVVFRGRYAAFTQLEALDMNVLGRDILRLFAVIVDQPAGVVCLIRDRHRYAVEHWAS